MEYKNKFNFKTTFEARTNYVISFDLEIQILAY
jgi:hypothetical protein